MATHAEASNINIIDPNPLHDQDIEKAIEDIYPNGSYPCCPDSIIFYIIDEGTVVYFTESLSALLYKLFLIGYERITMMVDNISYTVDFTNMIFYDRILYRRKVIGYCPKVNVDGYDYITWQINKLPKTWYGKRIVIMYQDNHNAMGNNATFILHRNGKIGIKRYNKTGLCTLLYHKKIISSIPEDDQLIELDELDVLDPTDIETYDMCKIVKELKSSNPDIDRIKYRALTVALSLLNNQHLRHESMVAIKDARSEIKYLIDKIHDDGSADMARSLDSLADMIYLLDNVCKIDSICYESYLKEHEPLYPSYGTADRFKNAEPEQVLKDFDISFNRVNDYSHDDVCVICLGDFECEAPIKMERCEGHFYHAACAIRLIDGSILHCQLCDTIYGDQHPPTQPSGRLTVYYTPKNYKYKIEANFCSGISALDNEEYEGKTFCISTDRIQHVSIFKTAWLQGKMFKIGHVPFEDSATVVPVVPMLPSVPGLYTRDKLLEAFRSVGVIF